MALLLPIIWIAGALAGFGLYWMLRLKKVVNRKWYDAAGMVAAGLAGGFLATAIVDWLNIIV